MTLMGHVCGNQIILDVPVSLPDGAAVRVELLHDASTLDALHLVEQSGVLDFWRDDAEDIYSVQDGEPL